MANPYTSFYGGFGEERDRLDTDRMKGRQEIDQALKDNPFATEAEVRRMLETYGGTRRGRAEAEQNFPEYWDQSQEISRRVLSEKARTLREKGIPAKQIRNELQMLSGGDVTQYGNLMANLDLMQTEDDRKAFREERSAIDDQINFENKISQNFEENVRTNFLNTGDLNQSVADAKQVIVEQFSAGLMNNAGQVEELNALIDKEANRILATPDKWSHAWVGARINEQAGAVTSLAGDYTPWEEAASILGVPANNPVGKAQYAAITQQQRKADMAQLRSDISDFMANDLTNAMFGSGNAQEIYQMFVQDNPLAQRYFEADGKDAAVERFIELFNATRQDSRRKAHEGQRASIRAEKLALVDSSKQNSTKAIAGIVGSIDGMNDATELAVSQAMSDIANTFHLDANTQTRILSYLRENSPDNKNYDEIVNELRQFIEGTPTHSEYADRMSAISNEGRGLIPNKIGTRTEYVEKYKPQVQKNLTQLQTNAEKLAAPTSNVIRPRAGGATYLGDYDAHIGLIDTSIGEVEAQIDSIDEMRFLYDDNRNFRITMDEEPGYNVENEKFFEDNLLQLQKLKQQLETARQKVNAAKLNKQKTISGDRTIGSYTDEELLDRVLMEMNAAGATPQQMLEFLGAAGGTGTFSGGGVNPRGKIRNRPNTGKLSDDAMRYLASFGIREDIQQANNPYGFPTDKKQAPPVDPLLALRDRLVELLRNQ